MKLDDDFSETAQLGLPNNIYRLHCETKVYASSMSVHFKRNGTTEAKVNSWVTEFNCFNFATQHVHSNVTGWLTQAEASVLWFLCTVKAKLHYAIWFEPASNQLRTSSEPASVMEFGFYGHTVVTSRQKAVSGDRRILLVVRLYATQKVAKF